MWEEEVVWLGRSLLTQKQIRNLKPPRYQNAADGILRDDRISALHKMIAGATGILLSVIVLESCPTS
jgi:hypothetical protein